MDARFPPAPWHLRGSGWVGLFAAERTPEPPHGWSAIGRELVVLLNRYTAPLTYDELAVCVPVHRGARAALWVPELWVNEPASLAGGRALWSLPKQLAEFAWSENGVKVVDARGALAELRCEPGLALLPAPLVVPALSFDGAAPLFALARGTARLGLARFAVERFRDDAPAVPSHQPRLAFELRHFRMLFPAATRLEVHTGARRPVSA